MTPEEMIQQEMGRIQALAPTPGGQVSEMVSDDDRLIQEEIARLSSDEHSNVFESKQYQKPLAELLGRKIFDSAILKPLHGLTDLANRINVAVSGQEDADQMLSGRVSRVLARYRQGLISEAEQDALAKGYNLKEIGRAESVGNFIGYVVPGIAAYKAVARTTAVGEASKVGMNVITDIGAGIVTGGVFNPGDARERLQGAAVEGATAGAIGLVLAPAANAIAGFRQKRAMLKLIDKNFEAEQEKLLTQFYADAPPPVDNPEVGGVLAQMMNEEQYLIRSPAAQHLLEQSADQQAIVQAIKDAAGDKANSGIVRSLAGDWFNTQAVIDSFKEQFPSLKFQAIKNTSGTYDLYFGTNSLNVKQLKQLKAEGRYAGQMLQHSSGMRYQYLRPAERDGWIMVKRADTGKVVRIKADHAGDLPYGIVQEDRIPSYSALYDDFSSYVKKKTGDAVSARGGLSDDELSAAVAKGTVRIDLSLQRTVKDPGAILNPQDIGYGYETLASMADARYKAAVSNFQNISLRAGPQAKETLEAAAEVEKALGDRNLWPMLPTDPAAPVLAPTTANATHMLQPREEVSLENMFNQWVKERGFLEDATVPQVGRVSQGKVDETAVVTVGNTTPTTVKTPSIVPTKASITGKKLAISTDELDAARLAFSTRLRKDLLSQIPKEDMAAYTKISEEYAAAVEASGNTLEGLGTTRGFHIQRDASGAIIARDINSGLQLGFADDATARNALLQIDRSESDVLGDMLPADLLNAPGWGVTLEPKVSDNLVRWGDYIPSNMFTEDMVNSIPFHALSSNRDFLLKMEEATGIPLWSKGFDTVMQASGKMQMEHLPWARRIEQIWKGFSTGERTQVAEWWRALEIQGLEQNTSEALALAKSMQLSGKQITAAQEARKLWDAGFQAAGLPRERYIDSYFHRIPDRLNGSPATPFNWDEIYPEGVPAHIKWAADMHRDGMLSNVEMDPEVVMHKWFRGWMMKKHMAEPLDNMNNLIKMKAKDLTPEQLAVMSAKANRPIDPESKLLPDPLEKGISDFIASVRGTRTADVRALGMGFKRLLAKMGIKAHDSLFDDYFNSALGTMYGAAQGLRPMLVARNFFDQMWWGATRMGFKHYDVSLQRAMSMDGFMEAAEAGAIRPHEAGTAMYDILFRQRMDVGAPTGSHTVPSEIGAGILRMLSWTGHKSKDLARKTLVPYASMDDMGRAWGYHWGKAFTDDWLVKLETKQIDEAEFMEKGLPYFAQPVRDRFMEIRRLMGREDALRYIGRQSADETYFIYGGGAQPMWMQSSWGRMGGMFGTWPMWAKDMITSTFRNASLGQRAAYLARMATITGAVALISKEAGVNMWNWFTPPGILYGGGPALDYVEDTRQLINAPVEQKASAAKRLGRDVGSLAFPGQVFLRDLSMALTSSDDPRQQALYMFLGRPAKKNYYMDQVYSSDPLTPIPLSPDRLLNSVVVPQGDPASYLNLPAFTK